MRHHVSYGIAIALAFAGCTSTAPARPRPEYAPPRSVPASAEASAARAREAAREQAAFNRSTCPVGLPGTSVIVTTDEQGAGLMFVAQSSHRVPELRRRVRGLARTQNHGARLAPGDALPSAARSAAEGGGSREPIATVHELERGAMLHFAPSELDQLSDVQGRVIDYAQRLAGGSCPLMSDEVSLLPSQVRRGEKPFEDLPTVPPGIIPGVSGVGVGTVAIPTTGAIF